jgi:hypothetical protein
LCHQCLRRRRPPRIWWKMAALDERSRAMGAWNNSSQTVEYMRKNWWNRPLAKNLKCRFYIFSKKYIKKSFSKPNFQNFWVKYSFFKLSIFKNFKNSENLDLRSFFHVLWEKNIKSKNFILGKWSIS